MIKTATVYRITEPTRRALRQLPAGERAIVDPLKLAWNSFGFTAFHNGEYVYKPAGVNGFLLNVQVRERVLPGKVIKTKLAEEIERMEDQQGRPMTKSEIMQMKDKVVHELLPNAFIKGSDIPVIVIGDQSFTGGFLLIGTSSAKRADDVLDLIRTSTKETLPMMPLAHGLDLPKFLGEVLHYGESRNDEIKFESGSSVVMKHDDKSTVRYKDLDLNDISDQIGKATTTGFRPVELHMFFGESDSDTFKMGFALTDKGLIKRLKFSDVLLKDVNEDAGQGDDKAAAYFDGTAALVIGELREMLKALRTASEDEL